MAQQKKKKLEKIIEGSQRKLPDSVTIRFYGEENKNVLEQVTKIAKRNKVNRNPLIVSILKAFVKEHS